ncbi:TFIIB-type zinc ribbon-containing protein [Allokutzneria albata]|uniref:Zn-finger domain-containing nucleic acid-binding protein n=1 Tax=Allokutzneria albata TaxID=211114 RepID=A0A1G9Z767_ALLAB|nr:zf-TFIIB domain-containing protein [Allokutzneria albata]SDN17164.1 Zn-finger domain-containing nucleic acid-binding protein [Allokutzneria albata]
MICPKCNDAMVNYERNGVHVDQCRGCQGLYLDPGELEQLVKASSKYYEHKRANGGEVDDKKRKRDKDDGFFEEILDFII